jgi:hypothetical protein
VISEAMSQSATTHNIMTTERQHVHVTHETHKPPPANITDGLHQQVGYNGLIAAVWSSTTVSKYGCATSPLVKRPLVLGNWVYYWPRMSVPYGMSGCGRDRERNGRLMVAGRHTSASFI